MAARANYVKIKTHTHVSHAPPVSPLETFAALLVVENTLPKKYNPTYCCRMIPAKKYKKSRFSLLMILTPLETGPMFCGRTYLDGNIMII